MQIQDWVALGLVWLIAGPLFVVAFRALGLRYEARPSLPIGPQIPEPKDVRQRAPLPARPGVTHPTRPARGPERARQPQVLTTATYHIWWDDGLAPVPESTPERVAGD